jgi:formylglycine-generating enzyme
MVVISGGTFTIGSPGTEAGRNSDEVLHPVTLTHDFWISSTEASQGEFEDLMGWNPSSLGGGGTGPELPVTNLSWYDAAAYLNQLTQLESGTPCYLFSGVTCNDTLAVGNNYMACMTATHRGIAAATVSLNGPPTVYDCTGYRLPTDAEWVYAARAGTTTATYNGDLDVAHLSCESGNAVLNPIAWFCGNTGYQLHAPGSLAANAWGLYDMSGNVAEWCYDKWVNYGAGPMTNPVTSPTSVTDCVIHGGGFDSEAKYVRVASRGLSNPADTLGFRSARSIP